MYLSWIRNKKIYIKFVALYVCVEIGTFPNFSLWCACSVCFLTPGGMEYAIHGDDYLSTYPIYTHIHPHSHTHRRGCDGPTKIEGRPIFLVLRQSEDRVSSTPFVHRSAPVFPDLSSFHLFLLSNSKDHSLQSIDNSLKFLFFFLFCESR